MITKKSGREIKRTENGASIILSMTHFYFLNDRLGSITYTFTINRSKYIYISEIHVQICSILICKNMITATTTESYCEATYKDYYSYC